jgi:hypothetical protein
MMGNYPTLTKYQSSSKELKRNSPGQRRFNNKPMCRHVILKSSWLEIFAVSFTSRSKERNPTYSRRARTHAEFSRLYQTFPICLNPTSFET